MKSIVLLFVLFISSISQAVSWKVYGPCNETPVIQGETNADLNKSVGEISVEIFEAKQVPYIGAPEGFNSIVGTPTGLDSIEVVSDTELRAYGWCYAINGRTPSEMPHKVKLKSQADKLVWFYAYSTNKEGEWQNDYCTPAYWVKAKQFCEKK